MREPLKRLARRPEAPGEHGREITEMQEALVRAGYFVDRSDIEWAWMKHSEQHASTWCPYTHPDQTVKHLLEWLVPLVFVPSSSRRQKCFRCGGPSEHHIDSIHMDLCDPCLKHLDALIFGHAYAYKGDEQ